MACRLEVAPQGGDAIPGERGHGNDRGIRERAAGQHCAHLALGLAQHVQSVLQGAFVLAKTTNDPAIARGTVTHLKRYVRMLFAPPGPA